MVQDEDEEGERPEVRESILRVDQDSVDFGRTPNYVPLGSQNPSRRKPRRERSIDEGREYRLPG